MNSKRRRNKTLLYSAGFFRKPFPVFRYSSGWGGGGPGGQYPPPVWLLGFTLKNLTNLTETNYETPQTLTAQYKAGILTGKRRKHKILCKIQILQQDTTRYSIFFCFGKDEVPSSNLGSSSKNPRKLRFLGIFCCKKLLCGLVKNFWPTLWPTRGNETTEPMDTRVPDRKKGFLSGVFLAPNRHDKIPQFNWGWIKNTLV